MYKLITRGLQAILAILVTTFALMGHAHAAKQITVRIEQPKSPVNLSSFNINFVALDLQGRTVTVKCFKKAPSEGAYSQFGTDQTFANGGNSGNCNVTSSIVTTEGTYSFRVEAVAGDGLGDNFDSEEATVTYDTSGPGDVRDYSKNKTGICEYTIHFKTANDSGATVKVELYRSDTVPFNADEGTRIQTIMLGSNEAKDTTDTPPDCDKTYYYAVRAFDAAGNGSALVGDNVTSITVINPTGVPVQGAIPVSGETGSVLGQVAGETGEAPEETIDEGGEALGEEVINLPQKGKTARNLRIAGAILALGALLYGLWKKNQSKKTT